MIKSGSSTADDRSDPQYTPGKVMLYSSRQSREESKLATGQWPWREKFRDTYAFPQNASTNVNGWACVTAADVPANVDVNAAATDSRSARVVLGAS